MIADTALHFARMGWEVFPLKPREKVPATYDGFKSASSDVRKVERWWKNVDYNLGLPTGKNFVVLDADSEEAYESIRALGTTEPPTVITGKGWQWYLTVPDFLVKNSAGKVSRGIDIRGVGGYVVAPPSIHPNGQAYKWVEFPFRLVPFPEWLEVFTRPKKAEPREERPPVFSSGGSTKYGAAALRKSCYRVFSASDGTRHATLAQVAFSIGQLVSSGQIPKLDAFDEVLAASLASGLEKTEAERTTKQCMLAGMKHPFYPRK